MFEPGMLVKCDHENQRQHAFWPLDNNAWTIDCNCETTLVFLETVKTFCGATRCLVLHPELGLVLAADCRLVRA